MDRQQLPVWPFAGPRCGDRANSTGASSVTSAGESLSAHALRDRLLSIHKQVIPLNKVARKPGRVH